MPQVEKNDFPLTAESGFNRYSGTTTKTAIFSANCSAAVLDPDIFGRTTVLQSPKPKLENTRRTKNILQESVATKLLLTLLVKVCDTKKTTTFWHDCSKQILLWVPCENCEGISLTDTALKKLMPLMITFARTLHYWDIRFSSNNLNYQRGRYVIFSTIRNRLLTPYIQFPYATSYWDRSQKFFVCCFSQRSFA